MFEAFRIIFTLIVVAAIVLWIGLEIRDRFFTNSPEAIRKRLLAKALETGRQLMEMESWEVKLRLNADKSFSMEEIAERAERAFGAKFTINTDELDFIDAAFLGAERPEVAGGEMHAFVGFEKRLFEVMQIPFDGGLLLSVNSVPGALHPRELNNGYSWTGKLASGFIDDGPVTVSLKHSEHGPLNAEKARQALGCDNVESALNWFGMPE